MPYRKPKYFYFDEKGKFVFDAFFSSEYEDEVSGDSGDRVTGDSRCENSCQPVNLAPTEDKKPVQNCGGNRKKHGKKNKKKKGGKKH